MVEPSNAGGQFKFSMQNLLDLVTFCCVALGATATTHGPYRFAIITAGLLLFEISGWEWRRRIVLTLKSAGLVALAVMAMALWRPEMRSEASIVVASCALGAPVAILATSIHNFDSGLHPIKGLIGFLSFVLLACWFFVPSVH